MGTKSKHAKIGLLGKFCPVGGKPCECPQANNYRENCKPNWTFKTKRPKRGSRWSYMHGTKGYYGKWEAHHILSISCVNRYPRNKSIKKTMELVLPETEWCINAKRNMLGMPKFGHTIMYYTSVRADAYRVGLDPPPFANIPQHDFEHNTQGGYCTDVLKELKKIWNRLQAAKKKHPEKVADWIIGELNDLSSDFRTKLRNRGKRQGGTHKAWTKALDGDDKKWYLPYSMATAAHASERYHPLSGARGRRSWEDLVNDKMEKIQNSMSAAGAG